MSALLAACACATCKGSCSSPSAWHASLLPRIALTQMQREERCALQCQDERCSVIIGMQAIKCATAQTCVVHIESAIMSSTMSSSGCSGTSSHAQKDTFLSVYGCELATPDADRICCLSAPRMAMHDSGICRYRRSRLCCT